MIKKHPMGGVNNLVNSKCYIQKFLKISLICLVSFCISFNVKAEDDVNDEILDEAVMTESLNKLKEEVYKRYPDINIDFDNIPDEFKISFLRSIIAKNVYEEYKNEFIEKFKNKSSKSGRSIMGLANSGIKGNCFERNGKKVCSEKQKAASIDFDNVIANLPNDVTMDVFWLDRGEYDKSECYRNGDRATVEICDMPEDLEDVQFHIAEYKDDSSISNHVSFINEDFEKNTHNTTTVSLSGNYSHFDENDYSLDILLNIFNESQTMEDAKYRQKQDIYINKTGFVEGKIPPTPYDDAADRHIYIQNTTVDINGTYHKGNNK
ncbi:hypothetical protein HDR59_03270 [bacterium]|nr:hypothetical protein [bacterium]